MYLLEISIVRSKASYQTYADIVSVHMKQNINDFLNKNLRY